MLDPRALGLMPPRGCGHGPGSQRGVKPDLAQAIRYLLPGLLHSGRGGHSAALYHGWSGGLVLLMWYRPFPHRLERCRARLDDAQALRDLPSPGRDLALAGEVSPQHHTVIEHPEVVAGQREIGCPPPG
jgi:hypothetical protein